MQNDKKEPFYEITLSSHVWPNHTRDYYIQKLNILKSNCRAFMLAEYVNIFDNLMIRGTIDRGIKKGLDPRVKHDIWMPMTLTYWFNFTDGKIVNWCQYMNEMMINSIFLGVKVCFSCFEEYLPRTPISNELLHMCINFALDDFFESHDVFSENAVNSSHILGLKQFYNLNVENQSEDINVVKVIVPCLKEGVRYSSPVDFKIKLNRLETSYIGFIRDGIRHLPDDEILIDLFKISTQRMHYPSGETVDYPKFSLNSAIKDEKHWIVIGENLWRTMTSLNPNQNAATNWCRLMSDELISQLYLSVNCVKYIHELCSQHADLGRQDPRRIFEDLMYRNLEGTCHKFLLIDSAKTPLNVGEEDRIQWSGVWGMQMFFYQNFRLIDKWLYEQLNREPDETESDDDIEDGPRLFPLPGHCITQEEFIKRNLALATAATPLKLRVGDPPLSLMQGLMREMDPEVVQRISELSTRERR